MGRGTLALFSTRHRNRIRAGTQLRAALRSQLHRGSGVSRRTSAVPDPAGIRALLGIGLTASLAMVLGLIALYVSDRYREVLFGIRVMARDVDGSQLVIGRPEDGRRIRDSVIGTVVAAVNGSHTRVS